MKRIGIMTFHRSINYGAFMQAYSLSKRIKKELPQAAVEIIDYTSRLMEENYKPRINISAIKHPVGFLAKKKQYDLFKNALGRLPLSEKSICSDGNTEEVLAAYENDYDVFVVGSDAVWNWCRRGFPNPYLMNFKKDVVKMSYAASAYGMDRSYVGEAEKNYFRESLKSFKFVGVRDQYTCDLVHEVCEENTPTFTCDPTVFLDLEDVYAEIGKAPEEFKEYIYKKLHISRDKKLIGVMGAPKDIIGKIKSQYGDKYILVNLYGVSRFTDKQLLDLTPFEWAAVFNLFEITVTSYFHGTLLSLRNHTPVINCDFTEFSKNNEGKICDVMKRMELLDCHFNDRQASNAMVAKLDEILNNRDEYVKAISHNMDELEKSSQAFFNQLGELIK